MTERSPEPGAPAPRVSVLMPTFKQATFLPAALESLLAQTFGDWELVVVDDGTPDETAAVLAPYLADPRIRYHRLPRNGGLGAALNIATGLAHGEFLAYLPSDDRYYPDHLARLVAALDAAPDLYLAYGGVRWGNKLRVAPTLQGAAAVGHEAEVLMNPPPVQKEGPLPSGNLLALVQVMHRRAYEGQVHWTPREERVSDTLLPDYWRGLLTCGARFGYAGAVTCEWVEHADQRERLIVAYTGGVARYRQYYGVGRGEWLRWEPTRGWPVDERVRYGRFAVDRDLPAHEGLTILLAGELGFNPERIMAFEERGHKLYGLWVPNPETWDTTGPFPYGNVGDIPYERGWADAVRAVRPDVIYALLNWQALPLIAEVLDADLGIPLVFHFKEGPFVCRDLGTWPTLIRILRESAGRVFIDQECLEWFQMATGGTLDPATTLVFDGDLPKADWMGDDWAPKLSAQDGQIHTVCTGRPIGIDPFEDLAAAGVHVHLYGVSFHQGFPAWVQRGLATGYLHLHPTVEPPDWVRELSQYDAAWFHVFSSDNGGDLRRAGWDDLNLPARLGTYAAAGLPWLLKANRGSRVAINSLARRHDVGLFFDDMADLGAQCRDHAHLAQLGANMRAARHHFAFDAYVDQLIALFYELVR